MSTMPQQNLPLPPLEQTQPPTKRAALLRMGILSLLLLCSPRLPGQTAAENAPANDLPEEFRLYSRLPAEKKLSWKMIVRNDQAQEQANRLPEVNIPKEIWHLPLLKGRHAFKVIFCQPFREPGRVFHIYVKADGDPETGRKPKGVKGVDYMYTLSCKEPGMETQWWNFWGKGGTAAKNYLSILRDDTLYLCLDMATEQKDNSSKFELMTTSYVWSEVNGEWKPGKSHHLGFVPVTGTAEPAATPMKEKFSPLLNPGLKLTGGKVFGWQLSGRGRAIEAIPKRDETENALVVGPLYHPEGLLQNINARPGHYLLRALARTNVFQIHLVAERAQMPIEVSSKYQWVELPFYVKHAKGKASSNIQLGFRYQCRPATGNASRLPATLWVKQVELSYLGDTALSDQWLETLPVDPLHHLELLAANPSWKRPGKVVFNDSFIGTELWLMTQGGKNDHSYVGHPDFSRDGKYLHIGARRAPAGLLRTDGSQRYLNNSWHGLVWLFPWMEKRLPEHADPADWVVAAQTDTGIDLQNAVTGATHHLPFPTFPGWQLAHYPGKSNYGLRGPRIAGITHETMVWLAENGKSVATSTVDGENFASFLIPSLSAKPDDDKAYPGMTFVGGKSGENWRDAIDGRDRRYFLFEINRDNLPNQASNPYQIFALPLTRSPRGLLRVVSHPAASVTEYVSSQTGMRKQKSAKWWDYAAGFPWSGDDARLLLEDGTVIHMSSLGAHSSFHTGGTASTVSLTGLENEANRFVGTYCKIDRISWPHEYRRNQDFALVGGYAEPASPILMIDLEHETMWTAVISNFHDYLNRYKTRWDKTAYHKPMFRLAPTFSPDFTKLSYFSPMLTGDDPERKWGDVYIAVVRYPEPPRNPRLGWRRTLTWERPRRHTEIKGFRLYYSPESGRGYRRLNDELLTGTRCRLPKSQPGFYALTSVEHSGLESRIFSAEIKLGDEPLFRHFLEPESARIQAPMVPVFDPAGASGGYAVAVSDPEHLHRRLLDKGLRGSVSFEIQVPSRKNLYFWARVRGMSELERASYTHGWPQQADDVAGGTMTLRCGGKNLGTFTIGGPNWHWIALDSPGLTLASPKATLELNTTNAGIALDCLCLTNDPQFQPSGRGREPRGKLTTPTNLQPAAITLQDIRRFDLDNTRIKISWNASNAPQGITRYQVYRGTHPDFPATPQHLLGSPADPVFYDCDVQPGAKFFYRVRAMDSWGNLSLPSVALPVTANTSPLHPAFQSHRKSGKGLASVIAFDASESKTKVGKLIKWQWDFGDGTKGSGLRTEHRFTDPGIYTVTLQIQNDQGEGAACRQRLSISPDWVEKARNQGGIWIEAENHSGEGGGSSRIMSGRVNASGTAISYWEKDLGHWLEWKIPLPADGNYAIALKYATKSKQSLRSCQIDGHSPGKAWEAIPFKGTGGYSNHADNWNWQLLKDKKGNRLQIKLDKGTHTLRLGNQGGGMALDAILLVPIHSGN